MTPLPLSTRIVVREGDSPAVETSWERFLDEHRRLDLFRLSLIASFISGGEAYCRDGIEIRRAP